MTSNIQLSFLIRHITLLITQLAGNVELTHVKQYA